MERFTRLYTELDRTTRTSEKVAALERYFRLAPARDAAHALFFLSGNRLKRVVKTGTMKAAALAASGVPEWLLDESYEAVGDFAETVALLLPDGVAGREAPLHEVVEQWIVPLTHADEQEGVRRLVESWARLGGPDGRERRLVFNKLVRGNFRVGVSTLLVARALAAVAGVEPAVMAHRLSGKVGVTEAAFAAVMSGRSTADDATRPYPFALAAQLDDPPESLGEPALWQVEYKWDGIRAQVLRRGTEAGGAAGPVVIWSRGEEIITGQFPEIAAAMSGAAGQIGLPVGTVLDGELLAWLHDGTAGGEGRALSFNALQARLNRKNVQPSLFDREGVVFVAFDVMEHEGRDVRTKRLDERRGILESLYRQRLAATGVVRLSPVLAAGPWVSVAQWRAGARAAANAEGVMLKRLDSPYHTGRAASGWWKWKVDPYSVDAVLIYAQPGSGKRAGLFTDYTFGVWDGDELTPFAKAYSGLDNEEIRRVDEFIRHHVIGRKGPVRMVKPELVFEIGFEGIQASPRHRSGVAVRFPRILRRRTDKTAKDADTIGMVRGLIAREER